MLTVVALGAAPAEAHKARAVTFQGSCSFHVNVRFAPPLGALPQQGSDFARGAGACSGSFTDRHGKVRRLDGARVVYVATDSGPSPSATRVSAPVNSRPSSSKLPWRGSCTARIATSISTAMHAAQKRV